jgi:methionyl-tRNA formyltransferase
MVKTLDDLDKGHKLARTPQPSVGITYAEKILKSEADIDWHLSAIEIDQRIRAFNPFPGSTSSLDGEQLKFWNSCLPSKTQILQNVTPGQVLGFDGDAVYIQCGEGVIKVLEMQKPGGKKTSASACLQSYRTQEKIIQFKKD